MPTPLSNRARQKRAQILAAARDLFIKDGFHRTSMDAVTDAAGVSKQTVYAYFPSKQSLLLSVLQDLLEDTVGNHTGLEPTPGSPIRDCTDLEAELLDLSDALVGTLMSEAYIGIARLVIAESAADPELGSLWVQSVIRPIIATASAIIDRGKDGGIVDPTVMSEDGARLLVGSLLTYVLADALLSPGASFKRPPRAARERLVDVLISGVLRRPSSTASGGRP